MSKLASMANKIKSIALCDYKENMTKPELKKVKRAEKAKAWNKIRFDILQLAAHRMDTLIMVHPLDAENIVKRLKKEGFDIEVEMIPDYPIFGKNKKRIGTIKIKW
jgi:hypothetical protein